MGQTLLHRHMPVVADHTAKGMGATPRGAEAPTAPSWRERWLTRDRIVVGVAMLSMWTVCAVITVHLCVSYADGGRQEKTAFDNVRLRTVEMPTVVVFDTIGQKCGAVLVECFFSQFRPTSQGGPVERDCEGIITQRSTSLSGEYLEAHILNQTKARSGGFVFRTFLDYISVDFEVVRNNNDNTTSPVTNITECGRDWGGRQGSRLGDQDITYATNAMLVPIADETLITTEQRFPRLDTTNLGTPVYAGLNHQSLLSFRLSQEHFVDGRVVNKASFKNTQFDLAVRPKHPVVAFSITVQADSFEVQQIKHIAGESLFTLMGAVFGWVSVLTGASIQGLLVASYLLHKSYSRKTARLQSLECGADTPLLHRPSSTDGSSGAHAVTPADADA